MTWYLVYSLNRSEVFYVGPVFQDASDAFSDASGSRIWERSIDDGATWQDVITVHYNSPNTHNGRNERNVA